MIPVQESFFLKNDQKWKSEEQVADFESRRRERLFGYGTCIYYDFIDFYGFCNFTTTHQQKAGIIFRNYYWTSFHMGLINHVKWILQRHRYRIIRKVSSMIKNPWFMDHETLKFETCKIKKSKITWDWASLDSWFWAHVTAVVTMIFFILLKTFEIFKSPNRIFLNGNNKHIESILQRHQFASTFVSYDLLL